MGQPTGSDLHVSRPLTNISVAYIQDQSDFAASRAFSPVLKKYLALGTVERSYARLGTRVDLEITVEFARQRVPATVVRRPFFDPARKRS